MVAYGFKSRFKTLIAQRVKVQTIRPEGKRRHAKVGDMLQLYVGMRTKQCRKIIPDQECIGSERIIIDVPGRPDAAAFYLTPDRPEQPWLLVDDAFAIRDGFKDARDMIDWWIAEHKPGQFVGRIIRWGER